MAKLVAVALPSDEVLALRVSMFPLLALRFVVPKVVMVPLLAVRVVMEPEEAVRVLMVPVVAERSLMFPVVATKEAIVALLAVRPAMKPKLVDVALPGTDSRRWCSPRRRGGRYLARGVGLQHAGREAGQRSAEREALLAVRKLMELLVAVRLVAPKVPIVPLEAEKFVNVEEPATRFASEASMALRFVEPKVVIVPLLDVRESRMALLAETLAKIFSPRRCCCRRARWTRRR